MNQNITFVVLIVTVTLEYFSMFKLSYAAFTPSELKKLYQQVHDKPTVDVSISKLSKILFSSYGYWLDNDIKRIRRANLKYPIILNDKYLIVDGWHRFIKAYIRGDKSIRAKFL